MRSGWLTLSEGRIETAWWGPDPSEAPTIVLLHEGLGCVALWRDVPALLAEATGLGVFAYSRFGYGQSDPVTLPRPMTYMHHEGQVVLPQVLAAAGVRKAVLVGHSDGGSIAAIYAGTVGAASPPLPRSHSSHPGTASSWAAPVPSHPDSASSWPGPVPSHPGAASLWAATTPSHPCPAPSWPGLTGPSRASEEGDGPVKPGHDEGVAAHNEIAATHDEVAAAHDRVADRDGGAPAHDGAPRHDGCIHALITIAAHFFVEDVNIASIHQIKGTYETTDLRGRLARHHRDPDNAFYGWNGAWLDPRFRDFDITGFLPTIRVPTLGLQGADDPYGTDQQLRVMQARITAPVETHLIQTARHAPHLEAKEVTLATITRFIAANVRQYVP